MPASADEVYVSDFRKLQTRNRYYIIPFGKRGCPYETASLYFFKFLLTGFVAFFYVP